MDNLSRFVRLTGEVNLLDIAKRLNINYLTRHVCAPGDVILGDWIDEVLNAWLGGKGSDRNDVGWIRGIGGTEAEERVVVVWIFEAIVCSNTIGTGSSRGGQFGGVELCTTIDHCHEGIGARRAC